MSFLSDLAAVATLKTDLGRIATALERIARAQEELAGIAPAAVVEDAPEDPPRIGERPDPDFHARVDATREWFRQMNHREPTDEELLREIDGLPIDADEAAAVLVARLARR